MNDEQIRKGFSAGIFVFQVGLIFLLISIIITFFKDLMLGLTFIGISIAIITAGSTLFFYFKGNPEEKRSYFGKCVDIFNPLKNPLFKKKRNEEIISTFRCPYNCENTYKNSRRFIGHLILKHDKSWKFLFLILTLLGIFLTIFSPLYSNYVQYGWNKFILHKELDFYLSINSIYLFENNESINLDGTNEPAYLNETKLIEFLDKQVVVGLIPPNPGNIIPLKKNLVDEKTKQNNCLFFSFYNINRIVPQKKLPSELKEKFPEGATKFIFNAPEREIIAKLSNICESCLGQSIYGINAGGKNIDKLNFEICYDERYFIEDTDFEKRGDHCFRVKKENLISNENFLGYVLIKDYNPQIYYTLWTEGLFSNIHGEYESNGLSFEISEKVPAQIVSGIVPNCQFI